MFHQAKVKNSLEAVENSFCGCGQDFCFAVCSVSSETRILVFRYYSREHWFLLTTDPKFVTPTAARKRLWHSPSSSSFVLDQKEKTEHVSKLVFTKLHKHTLAYSIQGLQAEGPTELTRGVFWQTNNLSKLWASTHDLLMQMSGVNIIPFYRWRSWSWQGSENLPRFTDSDSIKWQRWDKDTQFPVTASTPLDHHCTGAGLPTHLIWNDTE